MDRTPVPWVGRAGTLIAVVGAGILLLHLATKALDAELRLTGALLLVGGVLLRAVYAAWGSGGASSSSRPVR
ncbi:hypothetical protein [Micromonospora sp. NPDC126480]|uniref:hypothetical protein n=1 Tax=Micromonospora sp. NPDC126480 TaxID=3155312 RepID=UPI00332775CC